MCRSRQLVSLDHRSSDQEEWYSQSWTQGTISQETLLSRATLDNEILDINKPELDVIIGWNMSRRKRDWSWEGMNYFACGRNENNLWPEYKQWLFKTWLQRLLTFLPSGGEIYVDELMTISTNRVQKKWCCVTSKSGSENPMQLLVLCMHVCVYYMYACMQLLSTDKTSLLIWLLCTWWAKV